MPSPTRRRLLASLAGLSGLGGCTTDLSTESTSTAATDGAATPTRTPTGTSTPARTETTSPTPEPSPKATSSPTPEPFSADDLEFVVTVLRQPNGGAPGRIRASLTNHSGDLLELSGGDPLPVGYDTIPAEKVDASSPLVLFPQQSDAVNDYFLGGPDTPASIDDAVFDGCWRLPHELGYTTAGEIIRLRDDASIAADFFPLGRGDAGCPEGTYVAHGEMDGRVGGSGDGPVTWYGTVETTMRVRVEPTGALAVEGSMDVREY